MKQFEKDFPNLVGFGVFVNNNDTVIDIKNIQKHCLDKQKTIKILKNSRTIKEALRRVQNGNA